LVSKGGRSGNALAQSNLGVLYYHGWGVPQDFAEAVRWYRKAADQGELRICSSASKVASVTIAPGVVAQCRTRNCSPIVFLALELGFRPAPVRSSAPPAQPALLQAHDPRQHVYAGRLNTCLPPFAHIV
jgi:TPR repeat protein